MQKGLYTIQIEENLQELGPKELSRITSSIEQSGLKTASAASLQNRDRDQIMKTQLRLPEKRLEQKINQGSEYTLTTKRVPVLVGGSRLSGADSESE